jgi:hypothetical protein
MKPVQLLISASWKPRLCRNRGVKALTWLQKPASMKLATVNSPSIQVHEDERSLLMFIVHC